MHLPPGFAASLSKRAEKLLPILVILKNRLTPVSPVHDMVHRAAIFDSELSCHAAKTPLLHT